MTDEDIDRQRVGLTGIKSAETVTNHGQSARSAKFPSRGETMKDLPRADDSPRIRFAVRYRTQAVEGGVPWLDYSLHPGTKLGLHNALLAEHDRIEILRARGVPFECAVFVVHHGVAEPLTEEGAERLFACLPHGDVKWIDLCQCLLPPLPKSPASAAASVEQMTLFPHIPTPYDDLQVPPKPHALDVEV